MMKSGKPVTKCKGVKCAEDCTCRYCPANSVCDGGRCTGVQECSRTQAQRILRAERRLAEEEDTPCK